MRFIRYLVVLAAAAGVSLALAGPATATSSGPSGTVESRAGVERIDLGNGATLLPGVTSPEQLAASCPSGSFCGYGYDPAVGYSYGIEWDTCGWDNSIPWVGGGWWINYLPGTRDRVAMYAATGSQPIYTTPHSPSRDDTANWSPVYRILVCVA